MKWTRRVCEQRKTISIVKIIKINKRNEKIKMNIRSLMMSWWWVGKNGKKKDKNCTPTVPMCSMAAAVGDRYIEIYIHFLLFEVHPFICVCIHCELKLSSQRTTHVATRCSSENANEREIGRAILIITDEFLYWLLAIIFFFISFIHKSIFTHFQLTINDGYSICNIRTMATAKVTTHTGHQTVSPSQYIINEWLYQFSRS